MNKNLIVISIDKNIPIPPKGKSGQPKGTHKTYSYPFVDMNVGDSFLAPIEINYDRIVRVVGVTQRRLDTKYCSRKINGRVRVWRIK